MSFSITIDGRPVEVASDQSVLSAARALGLDIPTLCYLEKCGPLTSCLVCLVKVNGKLVPSCGTMVQPGMVVESETEEVHEARRTALELLFSDHVGDCLSPCNRLCPLGLNIPVMIRHIQAGNFRESAATVRGALPLAGVLGRLCHHPCEQGCRRANGDSSAAIRDMERFATEWESSAAAAEMLPGGKSVPKVPALESSNTGPGGSLLSSTAGETPAATKSVVIVGAGPTGLAAAFYLLRQGHAVTVVDRHEEAGGSLRTVPEADLPRAVLDREITQLQALGLELKLGVELGNHVTLEGLSRGFEAVLLATGEMNAAEAAKLGLALAGSVLKADPNTCQTPLPQVFAAGGAVKPVKQLVRAMAEGRAAAECLHRFLLGQAVRRPEKPFSSIMGRLAPGELEQFLATASSAARVSPCDRCAGLNHQEAPAEAARCLHCDCRSSGDCVLQHYAQVYNVDANRFRSERRQFEQVHQPGGVVFEPGKCIRCGICVKLTELAREPLGLTFIGRGFDVQVSAPLNHRIGEGLQKVAAECVQQCPTGALAFVETQ